MTTQQIIAQKRTYSIDEVMEILGLGRTTIFRLLASGQLKSLKILGRRLILREHLEELISTSIVGK